MPTEFGSGQAVTGDVECESGETDAVYQSNGRSAVLCAASFMRRHRRVSLFFF